MAPIRAIYVLPRQFKWHWILELNDLTHYERKEALSRNIFPLLQGHCRGQAIVIRYFFFAF
jgi:hypothetical protein